MKQNRSLKVKKLKLMKQTEPNFVTSLQYEASMKV